MKDLIKHLDGGLQERNIFVDCRGQTVAIDGHVWLHEFARRHAVAWGREDWVPIVDAVTQRAAHLLRAGIRTVFVFDGAPAPAKKATHDARTERRAKALENFFRNQDGDGPEVPHAAVSVTWDLVSASIDALRAKGFTYYVAPYEGDGQLAHLSLQGIVDAVFTVDTDLVVLGCKRTYLKVNYYTGSALLADQDKLPLPREHDKGEPMNLRELMSKHDDALAVLRTYAVLAGCDYDTKLRGVGPARALNLMNAHGTNLEAIVKACQDSPPGWLEKLRKGVECFENPVVYHVSGRYENKQRCLRSGRSSSNNAHLGSCCPDSQARARALGLITPSSGARDPETVERQPVQTVASDGLDPTYLEFRMVEGAVLRHGDPHGDTRSDPPRAPCDVVFANVAKNSVEDLTRWLRTRGLPKPTGAQKEALVKSVCDHLRKEKRSIGEGEVVFIRDPDGGSLHRYLQRRGKTFPQLDERYAAPPPLAPGWKTDMKDICRDCPIVELSLMCRFYQVKNAAKVPKVMKDSYARMVNRTAFPSLRFHDADPAGEPGLCWAQCIIPASMKPTPYPVSIALRYVEQEGYPKLVCDIVSVRCECVAAARREYAYCVHGATLLWILHNLAREDDIAKNYVPITSVACRWNTPTTGEAYDAMKPVAYMPITKDEASKPVKRNSAARAESAARVNFVAHDPADLVNNVPTKRTRVDAMKTLCDILTNDLGEKCAYEIQWLPQDEP